MNNCNREKAKIWEFIMADNHTPEVRSYNMSRIRAKDTKPEEKVRKHLFAQGFRYRKNDKRLPGKPDIVLPKYKTVVFVNGCFWPKHENCKKFVWPKSNLEYWENKLNRNAERDIHNQEALKAQGWNVIVVWECELKNDYDKTMDRVIQQIQEGHC